MENEGLLFHVTSELTETVNNNSPKKEFINLNNIKETGYYFDEDGVLRYIKDNSPFPFKSLLIPLFKVRYDIFRTLTAKYVREVLSQIGVISEILYTNSLPNGIRILHSHDFQAHTGPLLVIIQAGGVTRAGVWSSRLLMHSSGGINVASQLNQIKRALANKYGVLVINPSEKICSNTKNMSSSINNKDEMSPEEIIQIVWNNIIPRCKSNQILVWAHMYGGTSFLHPLQPPPDLKSYRHASLTSTSNCTYKNLHPNILPESYDQYVTKFYQKQLNNSLLTSVALNIANKYSDINKKLSNTSKIFNGDNCLTNNNKDQILNSINITNNLVDFDNSVVLPPPDYHTSSKKISKSACASTSRQIHGKRTSVSSNNATDNSSLHSDISNSIFGSSSPSKCAKLSDSILPQTSSGKSNNCDNLNNNKFDKDAQSSSSSPSSLQLDLERLQEKINVSWKKRSDEFWKSIKEKVVGMVFTDSAICLKMQGIKDSEILNWFKQNAVHYVACVEELGSDLNKSSWINEEVPTQSAGTAEHDIIPHVVTDNAFNFFEKKLTPKKYN